MIAKTAVEFKVDGVREQLTELEHWLAQAAQQGVGEHEVEGRLFREMLALGGRLLGAFVKLVGPGDLGEEVTLEEGRTVSFTFLLYCSTLQLHRSNRIQETGPGPRRPGRSCNRRRR
jgi:hypothetical protein